MTDDSDYVIITRRGHEDVALISVSELSSLIETAHLLSSPKNAERLATALNRAKAGKNPLNPLTTCAERLGKINEDIMTEMITIVAVVIGLAGLILNGQRNIREDIKGLEARLEKLDARIGVLERQQAKLEGLLEGLREAISGRAPTNR